MAYTITRYSLLNSNEYELHWNGEYGGRGEKRAQRKKATSEQMKRQNQWKRQQECRRTMKLNFEKGDLWCTLLYPAGTRKPIEEMTEDVSKFLGKLRRAYKKNGEELKYIIRQEIGAKGGLHVHLLLNRIRGEPATDKLIQEKWTHGRVHFENFGGEEEDFRLLSEYLVKESSEGQQKALDKLTEKEQKALLKYSTSRNLIRPKPEKKKYTRRTVRKLLQDGPRAAEGYVIDKNSIRRGINPYTGMSYLYYTEIRIEPGGRKT